MMSHKSDVDIEKPSRLFTAVLHENMGYLKRCLDSPTNGEIFARDELQNTVLHCAILEDKRLFLALLLEYVRDTQCFFKTNASGCNILHLAAIEDATWAADQLCKHSLMNRKIINSQNLKTGSTAAHWVATNGNIHVFKLLEEQGADFSMKNMMGETPLFKAVQYNQPQFLESFLRKHQSLINEPTKKGERPLTYAIYNNFVECVQILIDHGADIHHEDLALATKLGLVKTTTELYIAFEEHVAEELKGEIGQLIGFQNMRSHDIEKTPCSFFFKLFQCFEDNTDNAIRRNAKQAPFS
mmetsp:Transcript_2450/g.3478  ORF Transcript_2450/g.3478 Transcript_2450/m.3478 type:complete len:298 (+) Transcript_2450:118-1011(+)